MAFPRIHPAILLTPVETGYIAYDPAADRLHELNMVAALIAELCDGTRAIPEISALAAPFVPQGQEHAIAAWIENALAAGLLTQSDDAGPAALMSASQLSDLAAHLRDYGKVQPAYLCARRAAELAPGDAGAACELAELAHIVGRRDEARAAYRIYLAAHPEDAEVAHILTALSDEAPPPRVPDIVIQQLYKKFSGFYEANMIETLGYEGPQRMAELLDTVLGEKTGLAILDLGCGTGLSGLMLRPRAAFLAGVDLSPEMVERARARAIYDRLDVGELTAYLAQNDAQYDLIVACDTMIYFGDLTAVARAAKARLKPGGIFAFSVEQGEAAPFRLSDSGRYTHTMSHITSMAEAAGLKLLASRPGFLRMEYGNEVTGLFTALGRA